MSVDLILVVGVYLLSMLTVEYAPSYLSEKIAACGVIIGVGYTLFKDGFNGQSIGKRAYKIQVIRKDSKKPIGFGIAFIRGFIPCIPIVGWIDLYLILFTSSSQRMSDKMLGLEVIIIDPEFIEYTADTMLERSCYNEGNSIVCPTCAHEFKYIDSSLQRQCEKCRRELWK